jgi:hypothetical protein
VHPKIRCFFLKTSLLGGGQFVPPPKSDAQNFFGGGDTISMVLAMVFFKDYKKCNF